MLRDHGSRIPGFPEKLRKKFLSVNTGSGKDHKPLLILIMLMRLRNEGVEKTLFSDVKEALAEIINIISGGGPETLPSYPFWLLHHDGIWEVSKGGLRVEARDIGRVDPNRVRPNEKRMMAVNPEGAFNDEILKHLRSSPELIDPLADQVIARYFDSRKHTLVRQLVGYYEPTFSNQLVFNKNVYKAYQSQCSICRRKHKRLFNNLIELHATPIMPDTGNINVSARQGIALCNLHSTLFRSGLITFVADRDDYSLRISKQPMEHYSRPISRIYRKPGFDINKLKDRQIFIPTDKAERPSQQLLQMHNNNIFLG